jgi:hypothetical protein
MLPYLGFAFRESALEWISRSLMSPFSIVFQDAVFPALAVHLWLPILALCIALLKALNLFRIGIGKAQWFFKDGKDHPLDAIGYIAAALVFLGTGALRLVGVIR